jgi:Pacifastin inhibitor (LCMII)
MSKVFIGILVFIFGIAVGLALNKTPFLSALRIPYLGAKTTPTSMPTPTADLSRAEPKDWKTYTNTKFGFKFQYPTEAKITTRDPDPFPVVVQVENVSPRNGDAGSTYWGGWFIFISEPQPIKNNESLVQWAKQKLVSDLLIKQGSQTQPADTKIGNQEAIYWRSKGGGVDLLDYLIKTKNGVILITINPATGYETVINQILSTFKFTDTTASQQVLGIQLTQCCSCPTMIDAFQIGTNGWVAYDQGKDYTAQRPKACSLPNIGACAPCYNLDCQYKGVTYKDGETFRDICNTCSCESGEIMCTLMACL